MRLVPAWLTCQSLLEHQDPSAPARWPPTRASAARGQSLHSEIVSMRCATRFTSTAPHSAALLRKLMTTTTTTSQCNHRTRGHRRCLVRSRPPHLRQCPHHAVSRDTPAWACDRRQQRRNDWACALQTPRHRRHKLLLVARECGSYASWPGDHRSFRICLAHNGRQSTAPRDGRGSSMGSALSLPSRRYQPPLPTLRHVQMIRQGGMSESKSLWNAIGFLQRAFQDQPELFGSRSMESLFGTDTALYDATCIRVCFGEARIDKVFTSGAEEWLLFHKQSPLIC